MTQELNEELIQDDSTCEEDAQEKDVKNISDDCIQALKVMEDRYLRATADFENIKKRMEKEKVNAVSFANEQFAKELLLVLDTLEIALQSIQNSSNEKVDKLQEGVSLTCDQLRKVFEKNGIVLIKTDGEFNPEVHNAVLQVEDEKHNKGEIVQVMQKGYMIKDRVLRPAMVSIAK